MDYKRWTDKEHKYKGCVDCTYRNCQYCDDIVDYEKEAYNRLCDLEDKIENGTLVELPCKVGDKVWVMCYDSWCTMPIMQASVAKSLSQIVHWIESEELGTYVFLTQAEAEAKLRELEGGRE